jgi:hypothetical protein
MSSFIHPSAFILRFLLPSPSFTCICRALHFVYPHLYLFPSLFLSHIPFLLYYASNHHSSPRIHSAAGHSIRLSLIVTGVDSIIHRLQTLSRIFALFVITALKSEAIFWKHVCSYLTITKLEEQDVKTPIKCVFSSHFVFPSKTKFVIEISFLSFNESPKKYSNLFFFKLICSASRNNYKFTFLELVIMQK